MRIVGYIALALGLFYTFILYAKSKIKFALSLDDLNVKGNILKGESLTLNTLLKIDIANDNAFTISFSRLDITLFYKGEQIAKSTEVSKEKIVILPKLEEDFTHNLEFTLTQVFFDALQSQMQGKPLVIQYEVRMRLFGIPVPKFKNSFTYTN